MTHVIVKVNSSLVHSEVIINSGFRLLRFLCSVVWLWCT